MFRRRRTLSSFRDKRVWVSLLISMAVWVTGAFLISMLKAPDWAMYALVWGGPVVWLVVMFFIPIKGDDGERHTAFGLGKGPDDDT